MKHLRGAGILLALLAAVGFSTTSALAAKADPDAKDIVLKGDARCTGCHDEADEPTPHPSMIDLNPGVLRIGKSKHGTRADSRTPSCVNCHGESNDHVNHKGSGKPPKPERLFSTREGFPQSPASVRNEACIVCHQKDTIRAHWEGSRHQTADIACNSCHKIHAPHDKVRDKRTQAEVCYTCHKQQRTAMNKPSHHPVPEGKMACSDCHNPHGSAGPKLMKRDSVVETCYTCHMEKRGPFVHSHQPVDEDCGNCHDAHGTTAPTLLKARPPFLCQTCHTPHGPVQPAVATGAINPGWWSGPAVTQGRGCMNCHTQVHGSNNPSTASPTPQRLFR